MLRSRSNAQEQEQCSGAVLLSSNAEQQEQSSAIMLSSAEKQS